MFDGFEAIVLAAFFSVPVVCASVIGILFLLLGYPTVATWIIIVGFGAGFVGAWWLKGQL